METDQISNIELLIEEYESILNVSRNTKRKDQNEIDWEQVECLLEKNADWTASGAKEITKLTREYGIFALRNALALAIALQIDDGENGL